ncbi:hypothetical protein EDD53_2033 [Pacificibacter maritimus]|uniref:Uncharacterized protein n=1 Tax=Pacificibacter maritimus TaxID=762213 RepID=A0A3N4UGG2_9RHOB|nr:hypothetical protein [Pacificibacter maritimus]RPE66331.1 hypothetical protein EDD53_2033 [Pacificibacter maritimus]
MTALKEFDRLEATALWRPEGETQRIEVVMSMGEATLIISDLNDKTLSHWSLPAVERINSATESIAIFAPSPDTDERLETDDETMIAAITRIQRAIERGTPRSGRLRSLFVASAIAGAVALSVFWLPDALVRQAVSIVPEVTRAQIGTKLLGQVKRLAGQECTSVHGAQALHALKSQLMRPSAGGVVVFRSGVQLAQHLPGGYILLNRSVIEDYEDPDVVAGFILAEQQRIAQADPLEDLLRSAGLMASLKLLTSGSIPDKTLETYAEDLLRLDMAPVDINQLAERFTQAKVRPQPYAYAIDITGISTLPLIEAGDLNSETTDTVLEDGEWVALQDICSS